MKQPLYSLDTPGKQWGVYVLLCKDGTLYTGCTDCLERRLGMHNAGRGAKYTRGRTPVRLQYWEPCEDRSHALCREWHIKQLSKAEKLALIAGQKTQIQGADHDSQ